MTTSHSSAPKTTLKKRMVAGIAGTMAAFSLLTVAVPIGSASANSYSQNNSYYHNRYNNRDHNHNYPNNRNNYNNRYDNNRYNNFSYASRYQRPNHHYTMYRWVYLPRYHQWVLIGFNTYNQHWEYCSSGQLYGN